MIPGLQRELAEVLDCPLFRATVEGPLPERSWRNTVKEFFGVVESFPKYMGISLAKTTFGRRPGDALARDWLIGNIRTEARHAQWYIDWAVGLGIRYEELVEHRPGPEVLAVQEFLWSMAYRGSLAESFAAVNYAIEGSTGEWTRLVIPAFRQYFGDDKQTLMWLVEHAEYDDAHPREALELIKLTVTDEADQRKTEYAARRSLQLFRRGFDACHTLHTAPGRGLDPHAL
ncbi:TenA family transcriptional regulator [Mycobacterium decipiens]|nr:iron-containing redox enzyme family protein [Mycobacterium decipiens]